MLINHQILGDRLDSNRREILMVTFLGPTAPKTTLRKPALSEASRTEGLGSENLGWPLRVLVEHLNDMTLWHIEESIISDYSSISI